MAISKLVRHDMATFTSILSFQRVFSFSSYGHVLDRRTNGYGTVEGGPLADDGEYGRHGDTVTAAVLSTAVFLSLSLCSEYAANTIFSLNSI